MHSKLTYAIRTINQSLLNLKYISMSLVGLEVWLREVISMKSTTFLAFWDKLNSVFRNKKHTLRESTKKKQLVSACLGHH